LLRILLLNADIQHAINEPRMHHQWLPDNLFVEPDFPLYISHGLKSRNHNVRDFIKI